MKKTTVNDGSFAQNMRTQNVVLRLIDKARQRRDKEYGSERKKLQPIGASVESKKL